MNHIQLASSNTNSSTSNVSLTSIDPLITSPLATTKGDNLITGQFPQLTIVDNTIDNNTPENWTTTANMTYDENGDFAGTLSGSNSAVFECFKK